MMDHERSRLSLSASRQEIKKAPIRERDDLMVMLEGCYEMQANSELASLPKDTFINLPLQSGFTFAFWINVSAFSKKGERSIFYEHRALTFFNLVCSIKQNASISIQISNGGKRYDVLNSETKLKLNKWYFVAFKGEYNQITHFWDFSLFINANYECEISIMDFTPFNNCDIVIGAGKSQAYQGLLSDFILFFAPLDEHRIKSFYNEGKGDINLQTSSFTQKVLDKTDIESYTINFASQKKVPLQLAEDIEIGQKALSKMELDKSNMNEVTQVKIDEVFEQSPELLDQALILYKFSSWLYPVLAALVGGEMDRRSTIELDRFMFVLKFIKADISKDDLWRLAVATKSNEEVSMKDTKKAKSSSICFYELLNNIKLFFDPPPPVKETLSPNSDQNYQVIVSEVKQEAFNELSPIAVEKKHEPKKEQVTIEVLDGPAKGHVPRSMSEVDIQLKKLNDNEEHRLNYSVDDFRKREEYKMTLDNPVEEEEKIHFGDQQHTEEVNHDDQNEIFDQDELEIHEDNSEEGDGWPENLPIGWNNGKFEVIINRCHDCYIHFGNTRHYEEEYIDKFNEIGAEIKNIFPNCTVTGNYEKVKILGGFDVYIFGVGPISERDQYGRYLLFSKKDTKRLPTPKEITDQIILLTFSYGDSNEMEAAQLEFLKKFERVLPPRYEKCHDHPCGPPSKVIKPTTKGGIEKADNEIMVCKRWGCGQTYRDDKNANGACQFHHGRYLFGSIHGLWPEGWTCCNGVWDAPGCAVSCHAGIPKARNFHLCISHGEKNPRTSYPDSFCGKPFNDKTDTPCMLHPGFLFKKRGQRIAYWTCCKEAEKEATPCQSGSHRYADWPDEEAKIYFYDKPVINPGVSGSISESGLFQLFGKKSGYFRDVKPYKLRTTSGHRKLTKEEQDKLDKQPRYCLHWACEKIYQEVNNAKKICRYHPGRWDFGHTGINLTKVMAYQEESLLWRPHWTCCRRRWDEPGCTRGRHQGPLLSQFGEGERIYKWPDPRGQIYFRKKISSRWQEKIDTEYLYDEHEIELVWKECSASMGYGGRVRLDYLPNLCDRMHLHLLVISEDIAYQIRYQQVINMEAQRIVDDGEGFVDKEKFLKWWNMNVDELLNAVQKA